MADEKIDRDRIEAELEAIFHTPEFERAPVMRRLLEFLVRTTLAGGGDELKAYSVAVEGLGRDPDFDSQSDSYPRVQVGRLRKMLDAHYVHSPPEDGVRLYVKPGGYKVDFAAPEPAAVTGWQQPAWEDPGDAAAHRIFGAGLRHASPSAPQNFPWRLLGVGLVLLGAFAALVWIVQSTSDIRAPLRLASQPPVLEVSEIRANGGGDAAPVATAAHAILEDALHRSWLIRIRETTLNDGRDLAEPDRPVYRLEGHVDTSGMLGGRRIILTLLDLRSGEQIWSDTIAIPESGVMLAEAMRPAIVSLIAPFGVIATHQRGLIQPADQPGYACLLDYDRYFRDREAALRDRVDSCVMATIEREPRNATALAAASFLSFDPQNGPGTAERAARAVDYARRAVTANPYSADAQVADARVAFIAGQCARGRELGKRALALNAYSPELTGLIGYLLFGCGDPDAIPLLKSAIAEDPDVPTFYSAALILALVESGDSEGALRVADTIRPPGQGMSTQYAITQTIAAATRSDIPAAKAHWAKAQKTLPPGASPDRILAQYFYVPALRARIIAYLQKTGVLAPA